MNAPIIESPKRPPLAETLIDVRMGDRIMFDRQEALDAAIERAQHTDVRQQVRKTRHGNGRPGTLWVVQGIR